MYALRKNKYKAGAPAGCACFYGGDGGNRNRVRIYACNAFYAYSLSLGVPLTLRRQTDWALR
nr:MAG TPA: hypothetical protein [Caudoviricetes sp.]